MAAVRHKMGRKKTPGVEAQSERWTINLPRKYRLLFEEMRKRSRRTLVEEVSIALEQYLEAAGLWPLPDGQAEENS